MTPSEISAPRFGALGGKETKVKTLNPGEKTGFGDGFSYAIKVRCRENDSATEVEYTQTPHGVIKRKSGEEEEIGGIVTQELKPGEEITFHTKRKSFLRVRHEV